MYEKKKLLIRKLVWFALLIVTVGISIKYWKDWLFESTLSELWIWLIMFLDIIVPLFLIGSLLLSCKVYDYDGKEVIVYAGWFHHYMKVSGVPLDEHNTIMYFTPIVLSTTLKDGTILQATISLTNRISLKINNQLYTKEK